ncbi:DASH complex subunit Dad3-domain-containing protein [Syncephalis pseudoplumigaleata]|uniref:DASH complex subunit DAD3 n=1 Tax=Syncephalis pseudoplumigaleata TaxID=1712513 RepID=A0A4P9YZ15_9FUNG|nr:DASH complex subunit Dad3-domain-containing protein [Syncephalis pseudoplumigaleata]|eukprot:RKP25403.1 DASH complex subunit Dad3-domain-containing protein [Syncephalis pseudoplumigaleata]
MALETTAALRDEVLREYAQLAHSLDQMNTVIAGINAEQVSILTDKLREIERKFGLVYTLFKASVYAIVKEDVPAQPSATTNTATAMQAYHDPSSSATTTNRPAFL